jgi:hypothetical protein
MAAASRWVDDVQRDVVVVVVAVVVPVQMQMQVLGVVLLGRAAVGQGMAGRADNFTSRLHCGLGGQRAVGSGQWAVGRAGLVGLVVGGWRLTLAVGRVVEVAIVQRVGGCLRSRAARGVFQSRDQTRLAGCIC